MKQREAKMLMNGQKNQCLLSYPLNPVEEWTDDLVAKLSDDYNLS